jgi:hypothetical protein
VQILAGNPRATALLTTAYAQLQSMAGKITDKTLRTLFWQAPAPCKIRTLWQQTNNG